MVNPLPLCLPRFHSSLLVLQFFIRVHNYYFNNIIIFSLAAISQCDSKFVNWNILQENEEKRWIVWCYTPYRQYFSHINVPGTWELILKLIKGAAPCRSIDKSYIVDPYVVSKELHRFKKVESLRIRTENFTGKGSPAPHHGDDENQRNRLHACIRV